VTGAELETLPNAAALPTSASWRFSTSSSTARRTVRRRMGTDPPSHPDQRADPRRLRRPRAQRPARPLEPRTHRRNGLPRRARRRGHPARVTHHPRGRRIRPWSPSAPTAPSSPHADALTELAPPRRHPVRPFCGRRVPARHLTTPTTSAQRLQDPATRGSRRNGARVDRPANDVSTGGSSRAARVPQRRDRLPAVNFGLWVPIEGE
jgi:hypothetical protein